MVAEVQLLPDQWLGTQIAGLRMIKFVLPRTPDLPKGTLRAQGDSQAGGRDRRGVLNVQSALNCLRPLCPAGHRHGLLGGSTVKIADQSSLTPLIPH